MPPRGLSMPSSAISGILSVGYLPTPARAPKSLSVVYYSARAGLATMFDRRAARFEKRYAMTRLIDMARRARRARPAAPSREGAPAGPAGRPQAALDPRSARLAGLCRDAKARARAQARHRLRGGALSQHRRMLGKRHATFMIMGETCTRACAFCNVRTGLPDPLDENEPDRVADGVARLGLAHVVVTSVDRDDLADGGARHFSRTIAAIRRAAPGPRSRC